MMINNHPSSQKTGLSSHLPAFGSLNHRGFTIIEVIIVLAIAALILLVVFLAVPALQRSQRNNARKTDAARVAAAVIQFTTNNSTGILPADVTGCASVKDSAATLSQYSSLAPACVSGAAALPPNPAANTMYISVMAGAGSGLGTATTNVMVLATNATCLTPTTTNLSTNKAALLYTIEKGTAWDWVCLNVQ